MANKFEQQAKELEKRLSSIEEPRDCSSKSKEFTYIVYLGRLNENDILYGQENTWQDHWSTWGGSIRIKAANPKLAKQKTIDKLNDAGFYDLYITNITVDINEYN